MAKSRKVALVLLLGFFLLCTRTQTQTGFEAFELLGLAFVSVFKHPESLSNVAAVYLLTADARPSPNRIEPIFFRSGGA